MACGTSSRAPSRPPAAPVRVRSRMSTCRSSGRARRSLPAQRSSSRASHTNEPSAGHGKRGFCLQDRFHSTPFLLTASRIDELTQSGETDPPLPDRGFVASRTGESRLIISIGLGLLALFDGTIALWEAGCDIRAATVVAEPPVAVHRGFSRLDRHYLAAGDAKTQLLRRRL